ncbi:MAG: nucleotidyltransferase domain-containing protein [Fusobacteria bacterium]|nr:nucleotidyltransferase domain-containing protein [Fusobacteriota bacterium]
MKFEELSENVKSELEQIVAKLEPFEIVETIILFGSYTRGAQTENSDLDLFVIISDEDKRNMLDIRWELDDKAYDVRNMAKDILYCKKNKYLAHLKNKSYLHTQIKNEGIILYESTKSV